MVASSVPIRVSTIISTIYQPAFTGLSLLLARTMPSSLMLLDNDGDLTEKFENVLALIFSKYCTPAVTPGDNLPPNAFLSPENLDAWARDTNGAPLPQDQKDELDLLDQDDGKLSFKGFIQLYQLQTQADEEETWRDLAKHGFNRQLERS